MSLGTIQYRILNYEIIGYWISQSRLIPASTEDVIPQCLSLVIYLTLLHSVSRYSNTTLSHDQLMGLNSVKDRGNPVHTVRGAQLRVHNTKVFKYEALITMSSVVFVVSITLVRSSH